MTRGVGLRREDGAQPVGGEVFEDAVVEDARRVHDRGEGVCGGYGGDDPGERVGVGGVAGGEGDVGAQCLQFGPEFGGARGVGAAAPGEEQVPHAVPGDEVAGEDAAEDARAAGDQYGALGVPGARQGEDDLAVVLGLRHVAEGLAGVAHVPGDGGQRAQGAGGEQAGEVAEHLPDAVLARLAQFVRPVEGDVRVVADDLLGVADVGLAHLDQAPAGSEEPQRGVDEVARQGVEDDVDAASAARGPEPVLEAEVPRRGEAGVVPAVGAQQGALVLAGRETDVHEDGLPRLQAGEVAQAVVGGEEGDGHGGRLRPGPAVGYGGDHAGVGHGVGGEAARDQAHDPVAGGEVGDAVADGGDHTGGLGAQEYGRAGVHVQGVEHVAEVEAGGAHLYQQVTGGGGLGHLGAGDEFQLVDGALPRDVQSPGAGTGRHGERVAGAGPGQAGGVRLALTDGQLRFAGGERGGQGPPGVVVDVEVDEDEAAGVLGLGGAHQAPHGGAGQVVGGVAGSGGDGAAGDDDHPGRWRARGRGRCRGRPGRPPPPAPGRTAGRRRGVARWWRGVRSARRGCRRRAVGFRCRRARRRGYRGRRGRARRVRRRAG